MALEDQVAALVALGGENLALPQQIKDESVAQIAKVADQFAANQNAMNTTVYINQANGNDAAEGSEADPVKTIGEALDRTAVRGRCDARLTGAYHIDEDIRALGKRLVLSSASSVKHAVTHQPRIAQIGNTDFVSCDQIILDRDASFALFGLDWIMPERPNGSAGLSFSNSAGLVRATANNGLVSLTVGSAIMRRSATSEFPVFNTLRQPTSLFLSGVANGDQPMLGFWFRDLSNTAGTDPTTVGWLTSNAPSV